MRVFIRRLKTPGCSRIRPYLSSSFPCNPLTFSVDPLGESRDAVFIRRSSESAASKLLPLQQTDQLTSWTLSTHCRTLWKNGCFKKFEDLCEWAHRRQSRPHNRRVTNDVFRLVTKILTSWNQMSSWLSRLQGFNELHSDVASRFWLEAAVPELCAYAPCKCSVDADEMFCGDVCAMLGAHHWFATWRSPLPSRSSWTTRSCRGARVDTMGAVTVS
jgi:hypothetical protein